ncbi:S8 family serine peptidase [Variovorax paradoxus]|nr:S8 family serine peptidase [Variovorax paradoxus]
MDLERFARQGDRGHQSFLASFSNRGIKVALTAPGVAVVSAIFDNRWGVMSGTSMATPIASGVLSRRLAVNAVRDMPRDAVRAAAIVQLARDHAEARLGREHAGQRFAATIDAWIGTCSSARRAETRRRSPRRRKPPGRSVSRW